ncbi:MAG: SAM-dependent chlorinase/fluorinase [Planctomycetes bacterium]|nr:SAM-dependent chlorinase/fluorinase [Planctomycetota bacterium]
MSIIALTTDYGTRDHYVGVLKGVILSIAPQVRLVDVSHDIEPQNVQDAAFVLRQVWSFFPSGTIHLAVVDPGVGSDRRIVAGLYEGRYIVAPDNGLLTHVHRDFARGGLHVVQNRQFFLPEVSSTFQGRDVMAPVVAHLANGLPLRELGPSTDHIVMLSVPEQGRVAGESLWGAVVYVDRFGTLVTNIRREQLSNLGGGGRPPEVRVNGVDIGPLRSAFHEVEPGAPVALIGGGGLLEIAVNRGSAADRFGPPSRVQIEVR